MTEGNLENLVKKRDLLKKLVKYASLLIIIAPIYWIITHQDVETVEILLVTAGIRIGLRWYELRMSKKIMKQKGQESVKASIESYNNI